jgi:AcrR family transcriptional regulator
MAGPQRRARHRAALREEILSAAREIVLRDGFGALTMRKIAEAIDYSAGAIYLYFASREEIARELCRRGFEALLGALAPAATAADPRERLEELGRAYLRFALEQPETYRLIFMQDAIFLAAGFADEPAGGGPGEAALGLLVRAFEELKAQRRLPESADPSKLAEVFWTAGHGVVSLKLLQHEYPATPTVELFTLSSRALLDGLLGTT